MRQLCLFLLSVALFMNGPLWADEIAKPLPADVRVLIDISGSMKKTDPQNLRKPAVDLIVRLLPDNSKAGIWTFGQSVNMLVPHRVVDKAWRAEGSQKAHTINSVAMFTNIGGALEKAAEDYAAPSNDYRRNIILLTDGVVDISKEAVVNLNERKRVLTELLPRLKASDYRIHTIALSGDSDQELMKKLSIATDGISEVAETADELMSTFLRIFDQAVPAERVPLDENGFLVDSSIQEFTALIFRRAEVPATIIVAPDGKEFSDTDPKNNVNWYRTDKYDLITVQHPPAGQWKVKTDMAPGSRVTVVSNLQLTVQPMKSNIKSNQSLDLTYAFQENGKTILNKDFLNLLTGEVLISGGGTAEVKSTPLTMGAPADGNFHQQLEGFSGQGAFDVKILIDGKTFKREFIHHLNISDSAFKLEKTVDESSGKKVYGYKLTADLEAVDVSATTVKAIIKNSKANNLERDLNTIGNERWEFSFTPVQTAHYDISLNVTGKQIDGSPLTETIQADSFDFPDEASVLAAEHPASEASSSAASSEAAPAAEEHAPEAETKPEESSNVWLYIGIGIGNLLVLVLGYFIYRLIIGGKNKDDNDEIEKTLKTDVSSLQKNNAPTEKTVIDVSDEANMGTIPMSDNSPVGNNGEPEVKMPDDLMADNLFPLDNMEEPGDKDKN
ncbi:VWA domain-containing protein [Cellvibrio mixtus]|uniref:VWA domain-containing protein n=1 Tax=Cellvibrio mixtus TaxID=39650 RepID=UPI00058758B4|nr:vWA domain-containing protein [Cellvibrio mixtus]